MTSDIKNLEHRLPELKPGEQFSLEEKELIHYVDQRLLQGSFDLVSTSENLNFDEGLHNKLYKIYFNIMSTVGKATLSELFDQLENPVYNEASRDIPEEYYDKYRSEFFELIMFDSEIPEEGKSRILPHVYRKRPMKMMNAVRLRDEIKTYIEYKNLLTDKCNMRWHISVPEICLILGVSVEEWLAYNEPDQIKDARDYFTTLVLAQGTSKLHDYDLKNPAGVLADLKAHAGLKDISHIQVHGGKKRTNVLRKHKPKKGV